MVSELSAWGVAVSVAITVTFVHGSLFAPLRERGPKLWRELAKCSLCFGFWVGAGLELWRRWADLVAERQRVELWYLVLAAGVLSGAVSLLYSRIVEALDAVAAGADAARDALDRAPRLEASEQKEQQK